MPAKKNAKNLDNTSEKKSIRPSRIDEEDWLELTGCDEGQSAILPEIAAKCWKTVHCAEDLAYYLNLGSGSKTDIKSAEAMVPGWLVRGIDPTTGEPDYASLQFKYRFPPPKLDRNGNPVPGRFQRYRSASDLPTQPLFLDHPNPTFWQEVKGDLGKWFWITEGAKKAGALLSGGAAACSVPGVWNAQRLGRLHSKILDFLQLGRTVCVVFDRDWIGNKSVANALDDLGKRISATAAVVWIAIPPEGVKGVDDFIAQTVRQGGTREDAVALLQDQAITFKEWRSEYLVAKSDDLAARADDTGMPHAVNLELYLLQALTTSGEQPLPNLRSTDFYLGAHQAWWTALERLKGDGTVIDYNTVSQKLRDMGRLSLVLDTLGQQWNQSHNATQHALEDYRKVLLEKSARRQALSRLRQIEADLRDPDTTLEGVASQMQQAGFLLAVGEEESLSSFADLCGQVGAELMDRREGTSPADLFIPTHMPVFDSKAGALIRGELTLAAGRPGSGKTTFALFTALCMALAGRTTLIFSLEMPARQLVYRCLSAYCGIPYRRLVQGIVTDCELEMVFDAIARLSHIPLWIDDRPQTLASVEAKAAKVRFETGGLDLIVLDFIQLMVKDQRNTMGELTQISQGLKQIAKSQNSAFLCLSQLSREVERRSNKRPVSSDLRGAGQLEEIASVIIMLYRDAAYNPSSPLGIIGEILITKNRSDAVGVIPAIFHLSSYRVLDLTWTDHERTIGQIRSLIDRTIKPEHEHE